MIELKEFEIEGVIYKRNRWGGITQINPKPFKYNKEYNSTYDTEEYKANSLRLSQIRWELICKAIEKTPKKVLDFGYGNGAYLDYIADKTKAFGYDVATGYNGLGWNRVESLRASYDVVCFWDSLEHCKNLSFIKHLKTKYVAISLPHCNAKTVEAFKEWHHRKPDEHIHHFNASALQNLFVEAGYRLVLFNFAEDEIRKPKEEGKRNIVSAVFKKVV
jgi:hypothetical protein